MQSWKRLFLLVCACVVVVMGKNVENFRGKRTATSSSSPAALSSANGFENNCNSVQPFFNNMMLQLPLDNTKGSVCGGECCDEKTEALLRKQGQRDFAALLRHNSRSLQGLLTSTATMLQNHVSELARQQENNTLLLFSQVYHGMAVLSQGPINSLYKDIRQYILVNTTNSGSDSKYTTSPNLKESATRFFTDLFPLVYLGLADAQNYDKDFIPEYKDCLKKSFGNIKPFREIPRKVADSLTKSLEATRLLLQAFNIGAEVLNTTDALLIDEDASGNSECHDALLKMTYCPKCKGLAKSSKPCSGYCLNVLRGCITKYGAELDLPWNSYVEGIENLVNAMKKSNYETSNSADAVIRSLDGSISEAIMYAMEKGKEIDDKVKLSCGEPEFWQKKDPAMVLATSTPPTTGGKLRHTNPRLFSPLPENELEHFLTSIAKTRGFYGNLADTLCHDESFAELKDQRCWNGERIADYTKTVVDVSIDAQKYNPEVKPNTNNQNIDPRISDLVDKLRHVHHMALTSLGPAYSEVDYMQRDGADGSGSGNGDFDETDDDEYTRGSGSGNGPIHDDYGRSNHDSTKPDTKPPHHEPTNPSQTDGSHATTASMVLPTLLVITLLTTYI